VLRKNPFIEPCQPTIRKEPPTGPQWLHEVKLDGYRIQIHKAGKDVVLSAKTATTSPRGSPTSPMP
jgi:ATP-dependent DNA ligase